MKIGKINRKSIALSGFTSILKNYEGMPAELYVAGKLPNTRVPAVAIVGSRKPTAYGKEVTYSLARQLAAQDVAIISGLAYGIDAIAHQAALDAGGYTVAVFAQGLHRIYPSENTALAEAIVASGGALISEREMGYEARKYDFLARNRLVSGLADAVVVPEATERSGTLSTIGHALEQNKDIFAVPGPITSLLSVGPNKLLQQGAQVALSAEDILTSIAPQWRLLDSKKQCQTHLPLPDTPQEASVLECIDRGVHHRDALVEQLQLPISEALRLLTMMELKDLIRSQGELIYRK